MPLSDATLCENEPAADRRYLIGIAQSEDGKQFPRIALGQARPIGRRLIAKPGILPLGVATGSRLRLGQGCLSIGMPMQPASDFPHANGAHDWCRFGDVGSSQQGTDFGSGPLVKHCRQPGIAARE